MSPLILLLGDSHVMNWLSAFAEVRRRRGWTLTGLSRRSCLASPVTKKYKELFPRDGGSSVPCRTWLANAVAFIADQKTTAVFLTSVTKYQHYHQAFGNGAEDALKEATKHVERTIAEIRAAGIDVLAMKESPYIEDDVPTCLASAVQRLREGNAIAACTRQAADCLQDGPLNRAAKNMKIKMLSFDDAFCSVDGICPPIIGNVLAYRDQHHLAKTFAKTLELLERRIRSRAGANVMVISLYCFPPSVIIVREEDYRPRPRVPTVPVPRVPTTCNSLSDIRVHPIQTPLTRPLACLCRDWYISDALGLGRRNKGRGLSTSFLVYLRWVR